jgi:signal transduction histidine kinase
MAHTLDKLKKDLQVELSKEKIDFQRVAQLSQNILDQDQDSVRFSIDAKHIHRLGFELVGKQETALSELIKNAYDADATNVNIEFKDYSRPEGVLIIKDDGSGMTETDIRNSWMRISTDYKEANPISSRFGRSRAGRKGIGRFAVERLGKRLILETCVEGADKGLRVEFDWDKNFQPGRDLNGILHIIKRFPKNKETSGTTLIIENLRDKWTEKAFERVWKSVLLLQPPFKPVSRYRAKKASHKKYEPDPGFKVCINGRRGDDVAKEISIEKSFLEHRVARIDGVIDEKGNGTFNVKSKKLDYEDSTKSEKKYLLTGPLKVEAVYFIYSHDLITGFSVRKAIELGDKYGGIRIYRDGFRILPYGESRDDWLNLAFDSARRDLLVPASNWNFFGHVEITSEGNPLFEETSSREGLVENEAYEELQQFVRSCLEWAVLRIAAERGRKQRASQKGFKETPKKPSEKIPGILEKIKLQEITAKERFNKEMSASITDELEELRRDQVDYEESQEKRQEEMIQYETMLRIVASLGISISVFSHEIKGTLSTFKSSLQELQTLNSMNQSAVGGGDKGIFQDFHHSCDHLYDLANYVTSLISNSATREKKELPLYSLIHTFKKQFDRYFNVRGISFEIEVEPEYLRTHPMHRSEIDSVLFNFMTNSVKAIERAKTNVRKIKISASRSQNKYALISFQDTGTGIEDNIKDKVFDAFFTTTQYSGDEIAGPGTGLGLKIVKDIASSNGGFVKVAPPGEGFSCKLDFAIPIAAGQRKG